MNLHPAADDDDDIDDPPEIDPWVEMPSALLFNYEMLQGLVEEVTLQKDDHQSVQLGQSCRGLVNWGCGPRASVLGLWLKGARYGSRVL